MIVQQTLYDITDLKSHVRQVWLMLNGAAALVKQGNMPDVIEALDYLIDQITLRAIKLHCYINCTTRWVAAGSNLESFSIELDSREKQVMRLQHKFLKVSGECLIGSEEISALGDIKTAQILYDVSKSLESQAAIFKTAVADSESTRK